MKDERDEFRKKFNKELKTGLLGMLLLDIIARSDTPLYGYRIIKELERISNKDFILPEGTVYPILNSMENRGLLESTWGKGSVGPRRKYYTITETGRSCLRDILEDWANVSNSINHIINEKEEKE